MTRMVVAVAQRDEATWFFKLTGKTALMKKMEPTWIAFLESISFDETLNPVWQLPEGWQSGGERMGRYATLTYFDEQSNELEVAISSLGPQFDVLSNFNRWRGQLGLEHIGETELEDEVGELPYSAGKFMMFDRVGTLQGSMPPFAQQQPPPETRQQPPSQSPSTPDDSAKRIPQYSVPDGWQVDEDAPVVTARIVKDSPKGQVAISLTELPAELSTWTSSVASWIAEAGGDPDSVTDVEKQTESIVIDGRTGQFISLLNIPDATKGILAARVEVESMAWYIKLSGDAGEVAEYKSDLMAFIQSLEF
ncbi:MAG: hypothetical protein R3C03_05935 [Pirellulaceae bacterium]